LLAILIVMLVILVVAGLVLAYAAWPARGQRVPGAPWLGEAMDRARAKAPLIEDPEDAEDGADTAPEGAARLRR
jgi:hypothetical protein